MKIFLLVAMCLLIVSMSVSGTMIEIRSENTRPEIGNRTYVAYTPVVVPEESVYKYAATGVLIVDPRSRVEYNITANLSYQPGQTWYPFWMDRLQFGSCVVDLFYFEGGLPPSEINHMALLDSYEFTAAGRAAIYGSYNGTYGSYPASVWEVWNPLNKEKGFLVQLEADNYTALNILTEPSTFGWFNKTLEVGIGEPIHG